jgi:hypothetical protein
MAQQAIYTEHGSNTDIPNHSKHKEPVDKGNCLGEAGEELAITLRDPIS